MSRLSNLSRNPKRTLAGLTVALAAVGVAAGSGASFSSSSTDTAKTYTAGLLHHTNTATGALVSGTVSNIKPGFGTIAGTGETADNAAAIGDSHGRVVITNDGNLAGDFTVTATKTGAAYTGTNPAPADVCGGICAPLDDALKVRITKTDADGTAVELYDGLVKNVTAANLGTANTSNGFTLAAGATRTYDAYFYLPRTAGNAYQGGTAGLGLAFNEVQQ